MLKLMLFVKNRSNAKFGVIHPCTGEVVLFDEITDITFDSIDFHYGSDNTFARLSTKVSCIIPLNSIRTDCDDIDFHNGRPEKKK